MDEIAMEAENEFYLENAFTINESCFCSKAFVIIYSLGVGHQCNHQSIDAVKHSNHIEIHLFSIFVNFSALKLYRQKRSTKRYETH